MVSQQELCDVPPAGLQSAWIGRQATHLTNPYMTGSLPHRTGVESTSASVVASLERVITVLFRLQGLDVSELMGRGLTELCIAYKTTRLVHLCCDL